MGTSEHAPARHFMHVFARPARSIFSNALNFCCPDLILILRASRVMMCVSPPAQPSDEGACPGKLLFVKRRAWRIATIAHCFDRLIDLAERSRRHGGVLPPLSKEHQSESLVAKSPGPVERVTLAGVFFQRFAIRSDGLFQFPGSALALPEPEERNAQVVLDHGPVARDALARSFLQRLAISNDSLFQPCRSALALPEAEQRIAQVALGLSPGGRDSLAGLFLQRLAISNDSLFQPCRSALALPEAEQRIAQVALGLSPG